MIYIFHFKNNNLFDNINLYINNKINKKFYYKKYNFFYNKNKKIKILMLCLLI